MARQIANAHTIFHVSVSLILFPFIKPLTAFTKLLAPEKGQVEQAKITQFIDDHLRGVPSVAISHAVRELDRMGMTTLQILEMSQRALFNREDSTAHEIIRLECEFCDPLCDAIERFVDSVILEGGIDSLERKRCFQLKNVNVDLERVADHTENLAEATQDAIYHEVPFSSDATADLEPSFSKRIFP